MDLPRLRVASSEAWGREWSKAVVIARDAGGESAVEILLDYGPGDGGARHRTAWQDAIPWPARRPMPGGETEAAHLAGMAFRPALLLLAEAATAPGEGLLLPALAFLLRERFSTPKGPRAIVWLEVGQRARFVDVLRAVECGGGSPEVVFAETCRLYQREIENLELPAPRDAADGAALREDCDQPDRVILNGALTEDGRGILVRMKGRTIAPEDLPAALAPRKAALVRADLRAPWGIVLPVVRAVRETGLALQFAFVEEEEGFVPERFLAVPPPPVGTTVAEVAVIAGEDGSWTLDPDPGDPRGRAFALAAPDDTPTGALLQAALHLLARGAEGIGF